MSGHFSYEELLSTPEIFSIEKKKTARHFPPSVSQSTAHEKCQWVFQNKAEGFHRQNKFEKG